MNSIEHDYENDIIKDNEYEFNDTIIKRGKDYYENGMVLSVIKSTMITLRNIYHLYNMNTIIIIY